MISALGTSSMLSLSMQRILAQHRMSLVNSLTALATGSAINQASDNPAAMIASMHMGAALAQVQAVTLTAERSGNIANVADGALAQVSDLLGQAQTLAAANADSTRSAEEKNANQIQIDAAMSSIQRIARTTEFDGIRLFDGSLTLTAGYQSLSLNSVDPASLGQTQIDGTSYHLTDIASGGALDTTAGAASATNAAAVISAAQAQINTQREQIGAFGANAVAPTLANLASQFENLSSAASQIADTDFAAETSRLIRSQIMDWSAKALLRMTDQSRRRVIGLVGSGV